MVDENCDTCQFYRHHYSLTPKGLFRVYCGHCTYAKPRNRKPDASICENYIQGENVQACFVRKEFLSKELLAYMLALDLLPEIEDCPDL